MCILWINSSEKYLCHLVVFTFLERNKKHNRLHVTAKFKGKAKISEEWTRDERSWQSMHFYASLNKTGQN